MTMADMLPGFLEDEPERPTRWTPDEFLPQAALAGRIHVDQLTIAERGWLVAILTAKGITTDDIAAKLKCSRRLIQQIRCEAAAALTASLLKVQAEARQTAKRAQSTLVEAAITPYRAEIARLKQAHGRLIDQMAKGGCAPIIIGVPVPSGGRLKPRPTCTDTPLF